MWKSAKTVQQKEKEQIKKEKSIRKDAIFKKLDPIQKELWYGFLRYEKQRGIKSIEKTVCHLSAFLKYVNNTHTDIFGFGIKEAGEFRKYLLHVKNKKRDTHYTLKTIKTIISMTKRFFNYLYYFGLVKSNPFSEIEKLRMIEVRKNLKKKELTFNENIPREMQKPLRDFIQENKMSLFNSQQYLYHISKYFLFLKENNLTVNDFGIKEVMTYKKWLKETRTNTGRRYAGITIQNFLKDTRRFCRFLTEKGIISINPFTEIIKKRKYRGINKKWIELLEDFVKTEIMGEINKEKTKGQIKKFFSYLKKQKLNFREIEAKKYKTWLLKLKTKDGKKYAPGSIQILLKSVRRFYDFLKKKQIVGWNPFCLLKKRQTKKSNEEWKTRIAGFEIYLKIKGRSKRTIKEHKHRISMLFHYLEEKKLEVYQVKIADALAFQGWIIEKGKNQGGYSKGTIRNFITTAKVFFDYLKQEKMTHANPFNKLHKIKEEKSLPKNILNENEMSSMLDELEKYDEQKGLHEKKKRYICHVIAELMYSTGMRISEVAHIKKEDIDFSSGVITLTKTKEKRVRKVFLNEYIKQILKIYVEEMREFVIRGKEKDRLFGYVVGSLKNMLNRELKAACKKKNLKPTNSKGFRHAVGYHLLRAGCNIRYIQAILGHNCLRSTEIYTRVDKKDLKKVMEKYHPRKWKGK